MAPNGDRLDDAARAGWLYYVAGNTQDQIAAKLGVSRQSAQRLVSLAVSEGLVKVRIDHPIGRCMDLAARLTERFGLAFCDVVPTDPAAATNIVGVAQATALEIERWLRQPEPTVIAIGTGRTLKAAVEQLPPIACPDHKVVSLTGSIAPDGSAAYYNVIFTMADTVTVRSFPLPLPVIASSKEERDMLRSQPIIRPTLELAARADVAFVGIGELGPEAPLCVDGFVGEAEMEAMRAAGAAGEIVGWVFDTDGNVMAGFSNDRVTAPELAPARERPTIACAMGEKKQGAILAALAGRLITGLVTDEKTAEGLLARADEARTGAARTAPAPAAGWAPAKAD
ncbi:sugar-binding transcriptional regulator [Rhodobium gokarnense]|uniref:DNA-binding transcriptional regulator LsrR (DeoR family) n=1 Tax=Rhodobium gokarnense TaxID=364296 RepID=A0ABT3H9W3_9HYPH|nr:sugar-binding transcriptional regulator [Rhodobium gokarnense]MCW2307185.1 DNA-binding transcriptional regulator LsrR (DeoR family) [Rhodobium gokarnense]